MRAGKLRHRVDIRKKVNGEWTVVASGVPVSVVTLSGRDLEYARAQHNTATHQIRMRYHPEMRTSRQLYWAEEEKTFGVGHVDSVEGKRHEQVVIAEEIRS